VSILLLERSDGQRRHDPAAGELTRTFPTDSSDGLTLDDLITGVWEGLLADETVCCPACGGAMTPRYTARPRAVGGACGTCSTLLC
jgi:hypothetical protein